MGDLLGQPSEESGAAYPGDEAPKEQIARWMADGAERADLPPELPVMAALAETGLRNLTTGDADTLGYFQIPARIWNRGEYLGFPESAELQLRWFLDMALNIRASRVATNPDFGQDSAGYGEWIADVERPAAQYRNRYQARLDEARELIGSPAASDP